MKKIFFLVFILVTTNLAFAKIPQEILDKFYDGKKCFSFDEINEIRTNNKEYFIIAWGAKRATIISKNDLFKDKTNYLFFEDGIDTDKVKNKYLIIEGAGFCFIFNYEDTTKANSSRNVDLENPFAFIESRNYSSDLLKEIKEKKANNYLSLGIKEINCSSFYKEKLNTKNIDYNSDYLNLIIDVRNFESNWINRIPWVPGKDRNTSGIEEYLEITFNEPSDNLVVLNGYVDLEKRYLYKYNNRVKTAVITSLDKEHPFEFEYNFEDYVHFSEIKLPEKVGKVRLTIKDVYKGEKWDDTCIQAVITNRTE